MNHEDKRLFEGSIGEENKISAVLREELIDDMVTDEPRDGRFPAGLTYLGQMIAHDIVPSTDGLQTLCCGAVKPQLNLDSIYGNKEFQKVACEKGKFHFGPSSDKVKNMDLFRDERGALIPESRNDENYLVSQLHYFWLTFHNKVVDKFFSKVDDKLKLMAAREFVTEVFHQVVVDEFLNTLLDPVIHDLYCIQNKRFILEDNPLTSIPLEFSHAVFRFGHSMVRTGYKLKLTHEVDIDLVDLFVQDHSLPINSKHIIDWQAFFVKMDDGLFFQDGSAINMFIADPMSGAVCNDMVKHVIGLNLQADSNKNIPTGTQVVDWIRENVPDLAKKVGLRVFDRFKHPAFIGPLEHYRQKLPIKDLPLWLYVLIEDNSEGQIGMRLGPVGSIIVAEVLMNAIDSTRVLKRSGHSNRALNKTVNDKLAVFLKGNSPVKMMDLIEFVYG